MNQEWPLGCQEGCVVWSWSWGPGWEHSGGEEGFGFECVVVSATVGPPESSQLEMRPA